MSNDDYDAYQEELAGQRAAAAAAWDDAAAVDPGPMWNAFPEGSGPPSGFDTDLTELVGFPGTVGLPANIIVDAVGAKGRRPAHMVVDAVTGYPASLLGDAIEELSTLDESPGVGPIEFEGKEDYVRGGDSNAGHTYVRGETACLRGMDVVGTVPQAGSVMGKRLTTQQQKVGFVSKVVKSTTGGAHPYLALKVRPSDHHEDAIQKARTVAKHSKMIADSLKSFKSATPGAKVVGLDWVNLVGDGLEWDTLLGELESGFDEIETSTIGPTESAINTNLVGEGTDFARVNAAEFQLLGAAAGRPAARPPARRPVAPVRKGKSRQKIPSDAEIRKLASEISGKVAPKLNTSADTHEKKIKAATTKLQNGVKAAQKSYGFGGVRGQTVVGTSPPPGLLNSAAAYQQQQAAAAAAAASAAYPGTVPSPYPTTTDAYGNQVSAPATDAYGNPLPGTTDQYGNPTSSPDGSADLPPGAPDYGVGPAPDMTSDGVVMVAGTDFIPDPFPNGDDPNSFHSGGDQTMLPLGAVIYDKTMPLPRSGVGSRTRFFGGAPGSSGTGKSGFEFGNQTDNGHDDGWYWFFENAYYDHVSNDQRYKHDDASNWVSPPYNMPGAQYSPASDPGKARAEASQLTGWGPLVGNPTGTSPNNSGMQQRPVPTWTKGLRYDDGLDIWFWYWDMAPDWATGPALAQRLNKALLDYGSQVAAAKTEYLQAAAQAKVDAATAAQQAQAWAAQQAQMQQQQAAADQASAIQQQQQADQQSKDQAAYDTQSAQISLKQQQAQLDYDAKAAQAELDAYQKSLTTQGGRPGDGGDPGQFGDESDIPQQGYAASPGSSDDPWGDMSDISDGNDVPKDMAEFNAAQGRDQGPFVDGNDGSQGPSAAFKAEWAQGAGDR